MRIACVLFQSAEQKKSRFISSHVAEIPLAARIAAATVEAFERR
jgi:hypothetical protein